MDGDNPKPAQLPGKTDFKKYLEGKSQLSPLMLKFR